MAAHLLPETSCESLSDDIVPIDKENYFLFEAIHAQWDGEMFWDCRRIFDNIAEWLISVLVKDGRPVGAVYSMRDGLIKQFGSVTKMLESSEKIVLVDIVKGVNDRQYEIFDEHWANLSQYQSRILPDKNAEPICWCYIC